MLNPTQSAPQTPPTARPDVRVVKRGAGIGDSFRVLAELTEKGKRSGVVHKETALALGGKRRGMARVPEHNGRMEIAALRRHVRGNIRYKRDPHLLDTYESAERVLELGTSDCDGQTVLLTSMAQAAGYPVALRAISTRPDRKFNHVYGLVEVSPGEWLAADTTVDSALGWETDGTTRSRTVGVADGRPVPFLASGPGSPGIGNGADRAGSGGGVFRAVLVVAALVFGPRIIAKVAA